MLRASVSGFGIFEPLEESQVGMAARRDEPGDRMILGRFEPRQVDRRPRGLGQHAKRRGMREMRLAYSSRPGQQPGMVQAFARPMPT